MKYVWQAFVLNAFCTFYIEQVRDQHMFVAPNRRVSLKEFDSCPD